MSSKFPSLGHGSGSGNGSGSANNNRATISFLNWKPEHNEIRAPESNKGGIALALGGGLALGAVALWAAGKSNNSSHQETGSQTSAVEESILSVDMKLESIRRRQQQRRAGNMSTEPQA